MKSCQPIGGSSKAPASELLQEVAPFRDGGCRAFPYGLFEEPLCGLVCYGRSSTTLSGGKGLSLASESGVALDRGEADAEEAGSLGLGHDALVDGLDFFLLRPSE